MADEPNAPAGENPAPVLDLVRATSSRLPFRRAGLAFGQSEPSVTVPRDALDLDKVVLLASDPAITLEESEDGGETWSAFGPTLSQLLEAQAKAAAKAKK